MYPPLSGPFAAVSKLRDVPATTLKSAMEIMGAQKGNVQLATWGLKAELSIAAHSGFGDEFLSAFQTVYLRDTCACGRALFTRRPVAVEDVLDDFAFGPSRSVVLDAGVRAILSVPMISNSGALVGIVSTHRDTVSRPSDRQLRAINEMAQSAANAIIAFRAQARIASANIWQA
jgi:GAF domain-containing protein